MDSQKTMDIIHYRTTTGKGEEEEKGRGANFSHPPETASLVTGTQQKRFSLLSQEFPVLAGTRLVGR